MEITSGVYSHGAYGYSSDPPGTTMALYHCGVHIYKRRLYDHNPVGYVGDHSSPCMHPTRKYARACPNRAAWLTVGDGATAPSGS